MSGKIGAKRCGTPSGWARHQRSGEKPCDACALAKKEYDRAWRSAAPVTRRARLHARAQGKARQALVQAHPDEYQRYYAEAKAQLEAEAAEAEPAEQAS